VGRPGRQLTQERTGPGRQQRRHARIWSRANSSVGGKVDLAQEQRRENVSKERRGGVHTRISEAL
jgi:hypothetical protein